MRAQHGALHQHMERGRKARKEEERLRGLNNQGRRDTIAEQLEDDDVTSTWDEVVRRQLRFD
jgi:hypothetical protein